MNPRGLRRRLARRLADLERRDPDGAVAGWRWMWHALERSSSSVWRLRLRFAVLVLGDAALLAGWWVARAPRVLVRRSPAGAAAVLMALGLGLGAWWIQARSYPPRIPLARIEVERDRIRFEGQWMSLSDFRSVVDHYRINVAHVRLDPDARTGWVVAVQNALVQSKAGPIRVRFSGWTGPTGPPTRR